MIEAISTDIRLVTVQNLLLYRVRLLEAYPNITHAIFTRHGGFSLSPYQSLNLSISTGDDPETVRKNFGQACQAIEVRPDQTASCHQIHSARVFIVTRANQQRVMGKGDALITAEAGIYLFMRFADCTPLLFFDPVRQAVGSAHAGWRGTMQNIAGTTVAAMNREFGCRPADIITVIGPAIGPCCYEVGPEVVAAAQETFGDISDLFVYRSRQKGHAYFNLGWANERQLMEAGVQKIVDTRLCTSCKTDKFFSHRAEQGRTGRLGTMIGLRESAV